MSVKALGVAVMAVVWGLVAMPGVAVRAADVPPAAGEDVTLDGIGIGAQTVYGSHGASEVAFPPAASNLSPTGNFVRVFFSHSVDVAAGSTMLIAVNGEPLLTVPLTSGTAGGGVVETRLAQSLLDPQRPNRLQVRFSLIGPAATLYGRVDGQTAMHYELAPAPGYLPDLSQYPYSLLTSGASHPALGLVLPVSPNAQDLGAAFRVLADLGRRSASQQVRPQVVTANQESWLAAGGVDSVLVGRIGSLPAGPAVLASAGFRRDAGGWTSPAGQALKPDDGLVLVALSPWDHRTPLLLVTGGTQVAVTRAAAALVSGGEALAGPYVVVSAAGPSTTLGAPRSVQISVLSPRDLASFGAGRYRATVGFAVPAVDPDDTAVLELTVPALGAAVPSGAVEADVNGNWVASAALDVTGARPVRLEASLPGRLLRPGRNSLSLEFRIDSGRAQAPPLESAFTTAGADTAIAALSVPDPSPSAGDLRLLPFPFLEGGQPLQVVLADGETGTLAAAAQAMLALGSRSTQPPPMLGVAFAANWSGAGTDDLLVVGRPPAGSALEPIDAALPVVFERSGQVTVGSTGSGGRVRLNSALGAIEEQRTSDASGRQVLWLAATGPDALSSAAAALSDPGLSGTAATVDGSGRLSVLGGGGALLGGQGPSTAQVAEVVAAVLILVVVALQLLRPRRREG